MLEIYKYVVDLSCRPIISILLDTFTHQAPNRSVDFIIMAVNFRSVDSNWALLVA